MQTPPNQPTDVEAQVAALHQHYCELTGQKLMLRFDRQRAWYELLRAGFTQEDVEQVVRYLQKEIRAERRRVGALKLSNLLQPDQFEEDLNISRVKLRRAPTKTKAVRMEKPTDIFTAEEGARAFRNLRLQLQRGTIKPDFPTAQSANPTKQSDNHSTT
jgi:hypothetical protein